MTTVASLYVPVADDLQLVEDTLALTARTDFAPLQEMLEAVLSRGGKRLRPAIALLAGAFGSYDAQNQVLLATSIELLHTATLVHDDVIDTAQTRRGHPTVNARFDNAASVMLGDYMFAHAAELVARTGHVAVIRLFAQTLKTMATGELQQDIRAYDAESASMRDYYGRIHGKTASLFETAGRGGAMMAGAPAETVSALGEYGRCLGMAFQIVDDVLDFTATAASLGKPVGGDLLAGTLTLPSILLMESAAGEAVVAAAVRGPGGGAAGGAAGRGAGRDPLGRHPDALAGDGAGVAGSGRWGRCRGWGRATGGSGRRWRGSRRSSSSGGSRGGG